MQVKKARWRSTPPAIFPVLLGFMGLGIAWRNFGSIVPVAQPIGDVLVGISLALFIYFAALYIAKLIREPRAGFRDAHSPPARAGLAAFSMGVMLSSAVLLPHSLLLAKIALFGGILFHGAMIAVVSISIVRSPPEARRISPFLLLPFVGFIVAPIAGVPLGYLLLSAVLSVISLAAFAFITIAYVPKLLRNPPVQQLRPSVVIFLAPVALFGLAAGQMGPSWAFVPIWLASGVLGLAFVAFANWLGQGGWTPVWGSFTFPATAFINLQIMAYHKGFDMLALGGAVAGLLIATPLILYIVYRSFQAFLRGGLAKNTGAAIV